MERRKFTKEFKLEAVKLVTFEEGLELIRGINSPTKGGIAVAQASRDLDIAESVLRRWIREALAAPVAAFPGNGLQRAEMAEIAALKKEVAKLKV